MKYFKLFVAGEKGSLLQVIITIIIVGALSYNFWTGWRDVMYGTGAVMKERLESDQWLSQ